MKTEIDASYLRQIQKYPLLSAEEECELSKRIEKGDTNALNALVNSNLRLVVSIACRFRCTNMNIMDLVQEGNMGLMVAAEKFSWSFKTRFSTYAYPWIAQYMLRYANNRTSFISLPHRKEELIRKIQNAQAYLFQQYGKEAGAEEIALYLGLSEEKVRKTMAFSYTVASLDAETSTGETSSPIGELIPDSKYSPEEILLRDEQKREIFGMLNKLPGNERLVIWYRFNFENDLHTKTLREVSKIIGVSPEAVRQTEMRAVKHLKAAVAKAM